jgi:hypothetical protein
LVGRLFPVGARRVAPRAHARLFGVTKGRLLDDLSGIYDQIRRNGKAKGLSGFQVNDLLESCGLLDWDIGRLRTSQNFVHMVRGLPVKVLIIRPIGHQTAGQPLPRLLGSASGLVGV